MPDPHIRMSRVPTISDTGEVRLMTHARAMNAALFPVFLGRLLRGTSGGPFLIADLLQAHQTPAVGASAAAHPGRLEVFPLPRPGAQPR